VLPLSAAGSTVRAQQPSDIAFGPDGTAYILDFEKRTILKSVDGRSAQILPGVGGVGDQVPHLAVTGKLVVATDPARERIVVFDTNGRLRGVLTYPPRVGGTRPVGIAIAPDGKIYAADITGSIHRFSLRIPPETQAQLDAIP
jgi:DNA-binding beta-propeller fold protein YncE